MEYTDGTLSADILSLQNLKAELEELKKASMYRPGDVVTMSRMIADGYITGDTSYAKFYIPMAKPIAPEVKTITVTGKFRLRQNGKYIKNYDTLYGFNTDNGLDAVEDFSSQGIDIHVRMPGGVAFPNMTNNECVAIALIDINITFK